MLESSLNQLSAATRSPAGSGGLAPSRDAGADRVWRLVLLLCIGQVILWSVATGLAYHSPEIDSAEQLVWSFSMEGGYWKHPPLPSWVMHCMLALFGPSVVLTFVMAQAAIVIAMALIWRLGCEFMSPQRSLIAMLLTSLVTYHNLGGDNFNHNTVLLPLQVAMTLAFFLATRRGSWSLWAAAGLFAALSMLSKYVAWMPIAGLLLYLLLDRALHHRRTLIGLALGAAVFGLVMLPHVLWLQATDFVTFKYARMVLPTTDPSSSLRATVSFLVVQVERLMPMLFALAFLLIRTDKGMAGSLACVEPPRRDRMFLWMASLAPLTLTIIFGLVAQTELKPRWGANAFLFSGLLAMMLVQRRETTAMLRAALRFTIVLHLLLALSLALGQSLIAEHLGRGTRKNFPGALLTMETVRTWKAHTSAPLHIVVARTWLGGNIVANMPSRLAVLIAGDYGKTPWVRPQDVSDCGAMILEEQTIDSRGLPGENPAIHTLMAGASATGEWNLSSDEARPHAGHVIRWGILLPQHPASCAIQ